MKITYIGRHTGGVYLPAAAFVEHGGSVEVDDELGAELVASGEFEAAKAEKAPKPPKADEATTPTEEIA